MNIASIFRSATIKPEWAFTAEGVLWRLLCANGGRIVGEARDQERKSASFFCLDEQTGVPLWKDLRLEEPWWVGIEAAIGDTLLFHTYTKPDMPQHRGVRAFDLLSGSERWRNDDITFWFATNETLCGYRDFFEKRVGYELDLKTGEVLRSFEDSPQALLALKSAAVENQDLQDIAVPAPFDESSARDDLKGLLSKALRGSRPAGPIDVLKHRDCVVLSYYLESSRSQSDRPLFNNYLSVFRVPGETRLFSEITNSDMVLPVPDTFFIRGQRLMYLKEQETLVSLRLWES